MSGIFDGFSENIAYINAIKNKRIAQDAIQNNQGWQKAYYEVRNDRDEIAELAKDLLEKHKARNGLIAEKDAVISQKDIRIAELEQKLAIENAYAGAAIAVWDAYIEKHPDSPLHTTIVGKRKDGKPLRLSRKIWIDAFDRIAKSLGIKNPEIIRRY